MSKYERLGAYLSETSEDIVNLRFADIERILGFSLPRSALIHRSWWSNNKNNNVMTRVWRNAGFRTRHVDMTKLELVFKRAAHPKQAAAAPEARNGTGFGPSTRRRSIATLARSSDGESATQDPNCRHPIFGALKGYIRLVAGTDVTGPADSKAEERVWSEDTK